MDKQYTDLGDEILYKNANLYELGQDELKDYYFFAINVIDDESTGGLIGDVIEISKTDFAFEELINKYDGTVARRIGKNLSRRGPMILWW